MKANLLVWIFIIGCILQSNAQQRCGTYQHMQQALNNNPSLQNFQQRIAQFIQFRLSQQAGINARPAAPSPIKIPVVIHIVYHAPEENVTNEAVRNQLDALNRDYRRMNADSNLTPAIFKPVAADCNIEFELAKTDPQGRATSGIERIYSPVAKWYNDDKVKSKAEYGAKGWDAASYLNIWVCSMYDVLGYASIMGEEMEKDGVVINYTVFNNLNDGGAYNSGRTAVHEVGHWLGLKHIWGDADCGEDDINDTPKQSTYTIGCPGGVKLSCGNSPNGDMYMNFMDYTDDPCMNLFTNGQKDRMRALFDNGGFRNSILSSKALELPWAQEIPLPDSLPPAPAPQVYPNPATSGIILDMQSNDSWIGKSIVITNMSGQVLIHHTIITITDRINIGGLENGMYFIRGDKGDEKFSLKFVKR